MIDFARSCFDFCVVLLAIIGVIGLLFTTAMMMCWIVYATVHAVKGDWSVFEVNSQTGAEKQKRISPTRLGITPTSPKPQVTQYQFDKENLHEDHQSKS